MLSAGFVFFHEFKTYTGLPYIFNNVKDTGKFITPTCIF